MLNNMHLSFVSYAQELHGICEEGDSLSNEDMFLVFGKFGEMHAQS